MKILEPIWDTHYVKLLVLFFWILGLCNNFAYVLMLSAARDILSNEDLVNSSTTANYTRNIYDCNDVSTGVVLLADIVPGIIIKLIGPFLVHKINYPVRVSIIVITGAMSFLIVALTPSTLRFLTFIGIMFASLSSSFGEITFLSLTTLYDQIHPISGWSSGTGMAGVIASLGYAGFTSIGVSPRSTIFFMSFIPMLMLVSYILLPKHKTENAPTNVETVEMPFTVGLLANLRLIRPLLKYMIPLFLVYFAEYFINQGLFELLYFKNDFISDHKSQYRWYSFTYQFAVFVSRSSIMLFKMRHLPIFAILQIINVIIMLTQIFYGYMPSIWFAFAIILWEGLLGGGCYVNAFYMVSVEVEKNVREFSIAITSVADSVGIMLAGLAAIPVHKAICEYGERV